MTLSISQGKLNNINAQKQYSIYINNSDRELEIKDQNLPMLSFIAKLLTRIKQMPDKDFVVNEDYLQNNDAAVSVIPGENLEQTYEDYYPVIIKEIHSPDTVKSGAAKMSACLNKIMTEYFNS